MLSGFTFGGLFVARALWSELQEYGLLDSSPQAPVPGEARAPQEEDPQTGYGRSDERQRFRRDHGRSAHA